MTNWWKRLFLIMLFLGGGQLRAQEDPVYTVPVEWQKVELQKLVEEDLTRSLQSIVDATKFLVHVTVQINEAKTFAVADKEKGKATVDSFPLSKLGINRESNAYKKAITLTQNSIFARLKSISVDVTIDTTASRSQEAQIQLLASRVMKKYTDGAKIAFSRMNFLNLEEIARAKSLELAHTNVEAAKTLAAALAAGNEKIAEALNQGNERIANAIAATQNIKLPELKDGKTGAGLPSTWQEILVLFRVPLGIIVATFLLIFFVNGFKSIENKKVALMASAAQTAQASVSSSRAVEPVEVAPAAADTKDTGVGVVTQSVGATVGTGNGSANGSGFAQFKKMSEQYAETAAYLIKTWVNMDTPQAREALAALTKMIAVDVLVPVIAQLDDTLKSRFKKAASEPLDVESISRADSFIIEQMVETFLVNTIVLSDGLRALLSGMSIEECIECVQRDSQFGVSFMNVLQTPHVARLLSALPPASADQLINDGINFSPETITFLENHLGYVLSEIRQKRQRVRIPLVDKSIELIKILGPERESKIIQMLVNSGDHEVVLEATRRYFPAELILTLPADILKILIGKMPTQQRAYLIHSRPANEQKILLTAVGGQGRAREIIDSEIDEIKKDKKALAQIEKDKRKIWEQFVTNARRTMQSNSNIQDAANLVLNKWLEQKGIRSTEEVVHRAA